MQIYGYLPTSLIEWPGKISSVIFTGGCNFRCPYCQNGELVRGVNNLKKINWEDIFRDLCLRKKWIDGVCFTGGEPTLQKDIAEFLEILKMDGFLAQIETNGSMPEVLNDLLERRFLDRITMDVKTSLDHYEKVANIRQIQRHIEKSIKLIKSSGIESEFRITAVPGIVGEQEIIKIGEMLQGAGKTVLQQFKNKDVLNQSCTKIEPYSRDILEHYADILRKKNRNVEIRGCE